MRDRRVTPPYPFSAVVGLDDLRLALTLNAISPAIGGVLARGEKGTAKSTVVRALHALLPPITVVAGCRFACDPAAPDPQCPDGPHGDVLPEARAARLVELPVGATEDRLVGALDLERALTEGVRAYQPGLLAAAHRGVLYVDEVNLLADHLVDTLLDAAGMGRAYVERDGVSVRHAARFLLVGTMNPEEGELRPQLLDRFGLTVEVTASRNPAERADVVRRRLAYEADPEGFAARWAAEDASLAARIVEARTRLADVVLSDAALRRITAVCAAFDVDGLRADLVTARTAVALAAWHGRDHVTDDDIRRAAELALPHRRRRNPFDAPGLDQDKLDQALRDAAENDPDEDPDGPDGGGPGDGGPDGPDDGGPDDGGPGGADGPDGGTERNDPTADAPGTPSGTPPGTPDGGGPDVPAGPVPAGRPSADGAADAPRLPGPSPVEQAAVRAASPYRTKLLTVPGVGRNQSDATGRRSPAESRRGRVVRATRTDGPVTDVHLTATLLAAAPHQRSRGRTAGLILEKTDLRAAVRRGRESNTILFCVDASGSMAARQRMAAVKGAVLSLLLDAYQRRDTVGLVTFRRDTATLALPPTGSIEVAARRLDELPTGGRTPLAAGLAKSAEVIRLERRRNPHRRPLLVVVTDGRATHGKNARDEARRAAAYLAADRIASVVVDCEAGPIRLGLAQELAVHLGATALRLGDLSADGLATIARAA
ncbi:putative cobaltochelatase [Cryptosporangium aurantiacum]|uniref:Mg-protoporphyrin IX chelatase n=1 Tax=Cryptosporangium aurantiacum TaxID=134849 RepID=A0A1M7Q8Y2_9ACTN|nr:putative cobaltochelatase [Cryptosporangium aurantiacum]SHN27125.1 magnesium chelatase subunit D [Cryptosporangium aurantiacum]